MSEILPMVNWSNITLTLPPGAAEGGVGASYNIVYAWWGDHVILACVIISTFCLLYIVADKIRNQWRGN